MTQKILLDLFCCAGGAARGYQQAGFYVVGVDIKPQPHYVGDEFFQGDALDFGRRYGKDFYAIHASPPCQGYSEETRKEYRGNHQKLIAPTRDLLKRSGAHYVIENVKGARFDLVDPFILCGSMFGLKVFRHRYFETSFYTGLTSPCNHNFKPVYITGTRWKDGKKCDDLIADKKAACGIDWMIMTELDEAIPPAYTRWIGERIP